MNTKHRWSRWGTDGMPALGGLVVSALVAASILVGADGAHAGGGYCASGSFGECTWWIPGTETGADTQANSSTGQTHYGATSTLFVGNGNGLSGIEAHGSIAGVLQQAQDEPRWANPGGGRRIKVVDHKGGGLFGHRKGPAGGATRHGRRSRRRTRTGSRW